MCPSVDGVLLESGELISAGMVVVATAGWSSGLLQKSVGLSIPTIRLHATAGRTEPLDDAGTSSAAPFPNVGVWSDDCAFRLRNDGGLTIADGGHFEEHDIALETLVHGWRFLPSLKKHWAQTHLKLRKDSFPTPRTDACPEPAHSRLLFAAERFAELFPGRAPLQMAESWAGFIDITPDMVPVIDAVAIEGLVVSTGYSGHGLGIAPGVRFSAVFRLFCH